MNLKPDSKLDSRPIWQSEINLNLIQERGENTLMTHLGIEFTDIGPDYLIARMSVDSRTRQPLGIMHGGASCVLAETVGSVAANFCIDNKIFYAVGLDINTNHIKSIREGYVYATARPYHLGRSTQVWSIEIKDKDQKLISINRLTMAVLKKDN